MNTVLTITLFIALCVAIVLDIIRVVQYRATNKYNRPRAIKEFVYRVIELSEKYSELKENNLYTDGLNFPDWCVEHWDDDKKK